MSRYLLSICLSLFFSIDVSAKETVWELGAGFTGINLPLYPGSSENKNYLIPFPYLRLRSKYFEIDDGMRGFLYESPDLRLNISADLGVPVNSADSRLRTNMPDLLTALQIGPSLEIVFAGGRTQTYEFRLELPIRTAVASDLSETDNLGWVIEPRITYETLRPFKTGWAYQISTGFKYAAEEYHRYYYDVPTAYATPERPFYEADSGYSGFFLDLVNNWRTGDFTYFIFLRYQNLNGTVFEDSPLVEDTNYWGLGVGMVWTFMDSRK